MTPEEIIKRVGMLESSRANWANYWQDLANFCLPRKAFVTHKRTSGEKLDFHRIFDSVAIRALQTMAAGFASHLTNPSSKWFRLSTRNREFMKSKENRLWFKKAEDEIFSTLNTANFEPTIQEFYMDAGCFGTGAIFTQRDFKDRVRFTSLPISEVFIEEDSAGRVTRLYRQFEYTAQQAWDLWGKNAGEDITKAIEEGKNFEKKFKFIHAVFPRDKRQEGKKDSLNMPIASMWIEVSKQKIVQEGGFEEFPYAVGRFNKETGDPWGFSPAMNVLSDIKMINAEKRTVIRAAMKIVDPPFHIPSRGFILPLNLNPAGANYRNPKLANDSYQSIKTDGNIPIGFEMIRDVAADIEKGFFVPLFRVFSDITKQMTIPEVQRRISENMVLLGPVVGRFTQEVLDPIILRVFNILFKDGFLPPPPEAIQGQELDILYVSQLALAQRAQEVNSIESFLVDVSEIARVIPSVIDKIDGDKVVDIISQVKNINPDIMRGDDDIEAIRTARAEQEAQLAQAGALQQGAETAKIVSEADKNTRQ